MKKNRQPKHRKRYNTAEMEDDKQALIHQRYDKAYKRFLGNPEAFCPNFFMDAQPGKRENSAETGTPKYSNGW